MVIVHPSEMYIRSMHHGSIYLRPISNIGHLDHRPRSRDYLRDRAAPVPDPSLRSRALLLALDRLQETEPELSTVGAQRRVESMNGTDKEPRREFCRIVNRVGPGFKCCCIRYAAWYEPGTAMGIAHRGMHGAGICRVPTVCSRFLKMKACAVYFLNRTHPRHTRHPTFYIFSHRSTRVLPE
jgi:hypothetical protein